MSFDYGTTPRSTPRGAVMGLFVVGGILAVVFGIWVFAPYVAAATDRTTSGQITAWHPRFEGARSGSVDYAPTIVYTVGGTSYSITSVFAAPVDVERDNPVGSTVAVHYNPNNPASAEWAAKETDVAINFWGVLGLALGLILVIAALGMLTLNARARKVQP